MLKEQRNALPESVKGGSAVPESGTQKKLDVLLQELVPEHIEASYMGLGGEHVVFTVRATEKKIAKRKQELEKEKGEKLDERRDIVYKVNYYTSLLKYPRDFADQAKQDIVIEKMTEDIIQREQQIRALRSHFGFHAVPAEQSMVRMLPITAAVFNRLKPKWASERQDIPKEIPALVTIQRRAKGIPEKPQIQDASEHDVSEHTVDLTSYYADHVSRTKGRKEELSDIDYDRAHRLLVGARVEPRDPFTTDRKEREERHKDIVKMFPRLAAVVKRQKIDEKFAAELRSAARRMVTYAQNAHRPILDVAGKYNIILTKQEDASWRLLLLDAITPGSPTRIGEINDIAQQILHKRPVDRRDRLQAEQILHFIRFVNALAIIADIPERISVSKAVLDIPPLEWREEIAKQTQEQPEARAAAAPIKPPPMEEHTRMSDAGGA